MVSPVFSNIRIQESPEKPEVPKDINPVTRGDSPDYRTSVKKYGLGKQDKDTGWFAFSLADLDPKSKEYNKLYSQAYQRFRSAWNAITKTSWWIGWKASLVGTPTIIVTKDPRMKTAWVSMGGGGRINMYFNADFILNISIYDIAFVIAHEAMHFIFDHLPRMKGKEHVRLSNGGTLWNIVTDAYINEYLIRTFSAYGADSHHHLDWILDNGIRWGSLPKSVQEELPVENLNDYTAEQIYYAVLDFLEKNRIDTNKLKDVTPKSEKDTRRKIMPAYPGRVCKNRNNGKYYVVTKVDKDEYGNVTEIKTRELPGYDPKNPKAILQK